MLKHASISALLTMVVGSLAIATTPGCVNYECGPAGAPPPASVEKTKSYGVQLCEAGPTTLIIRKNNLGRMKTTYETMLAFKNENGAVTFQAEDKSVFIDNGLVYLRTHIRNDLGNELGNDLRQDFKAAGENTDVDAALCDRSS